MRSRQFIKEPKHDILQPALAYDCASSYYDAWSWQQVWKAAERNFLKDALAKTKHSKNVLDIGCGTGSLLASLAQSDEHSELVGIDISRGMLEHARAKAVGKNIKLIHNDFLKHRFKPRSFDLIFMCRVASHISDLDACFSKVATLLKDGGTFAFSDVYSRHPYKFTRLPFKETKIPVVTHKHRLQQIVRVAYEHALVGRVTPCATRDLPKWLQTNPHLPRTLGKRTKAAKARPFGCLILFSLQPGSSAICHKDIPAHAQKSLLTTE